MIDWDWVTLLVTVVAVGLFWLRGRNGQSSEASQIDLAVRMARTAVRAAEQLYKSGDLPADARFEYVLNILQNAFPKMDEQQCIAAIEAEVYMFNKDNKTT